MHRVGKVIYAASTAISSLSFKEYASVSSHIKNVKNFSEKENAKSFFYDDSFEDYVDYASNGQANRVINEMARLMPMKILPYKNSI